MSAAPVCLAQLRRHCAKRTVEQLCLPRALSRDALQQLDGAVPTNRQLAAKASLYHRGEHLSALFVLRSGALMTHAESVPARQQVLGFCLPGELVGLDGLASGRHLATCTALEPSAVYLIPGDRVEETCARVPGLRRQLIRLVSRVVCSEHQVLLSLHHLNQERRLALFLLDLFRRYRQLGSAPTCLRLPMSRHQLASYLGVTPASVSLTFARLRDAGALRILGRTVHLLDAAHMIDLSGDAVPLRHFAPAAQWAWPAHVAASAEPPGGSPTREGRPPAPFPG